MHKLILSVLGAILLLPSVAFAHGGVEGGGAFISGLTHPILGLDHLLAIIAVGMLSAQIRRHAMWLLPFAFVLAMLGGAVLAIRGIPLFTVELLITISVVVMGIAVVLERKPPLLLFIALVAFFALFHGHAHGTEMSPDYDYLHYCGGFVVGALVINLAGIAIGVIAEKKQVGQLVRYLGAGIAGIGVHILIG